MNTYKNKILSGWQLDFAGIGAPKCATSWVAKCLDEHPQICMPETLGTAFFAKQGFYGPSKGWKKSNGWYKNLFSEKTKNQIRGEVSVEYLADKETPKLLSKNFPSIKLFVILRNPVQRLISHYEHLKINEHPLPPLKNIIMGNHELIRHGFYYQCLKKYLNLIPKEKILILFYNDIQKNPVNFIQTLYKFLNVDPNFIPPSTFKKINTKEEKVGPLHKNKKISASYTKIRGTPLGQGILKITRFFKINKLVAIIFSPLSSDTKSKDRKSGENSKIRQSIYKLYEQDIANVEKLTGRNLDSWRII